MINILPGATSKNAVVAIRVSTIKQGSEGDSPEAQKEQIELFASNRGIKILQYFIFIESASKELQPMQMAIDYCKDPKHDIQLFIVKSIDRFTRGGSYPYDQMKRQLDECGIHLVDIYGVIDSKVVNTLDHLGFEYKWSKYYPSKKIEILEAERAKDEVRDILSRMIGSEIRYTQLGYWMRQPPYGFISKSVETKHGKRCILAPHKTESRYIIKMFELRAKGVKSDDEIVQEINDLGFRTRVSYTRDKNDHTNIISIKGGKLLTRKNMQRIIKNPIYAGINNEKWTGDKVVNLVSNGLVSIDLFNQANRGKKMIIKDDNNEFTIHTKAVSDSPINKGGRIYNYPYKKYLLCPICNKSLLGSASRGKNGKHYPAYHCSSRGHYYRIPKKQIEDAVALYINNISISKENIKEIINAIDIELEFRSQSKTQEIQVIKKRIVELNNDMAATIDKIRIITTPTVIKILEEDLVRINQKIQDLNQLRGNKELKRVNDINDIHTKALYYMEHLGELLEKQTDLTKKARLFTLFIKEQITTEAMLEKL